MKMAAPKYLTGDKAGIDEFLNKFDVRRCIHDYQDLSNIDQS